MHTLTRSSSESVIPEYEISPNAPSAPEFHLLDGSLQLENTNPVQTYESNTPVVEEVIPPNYNELHIGNTWCRMHGVRSHPLNTMHFLMTKKGLNPVLVVRFGTSLYKQLVKDFRIVVTNVNPDRIYFTTVHYKDVDINVCMISDLSIVDDMILVSITRGYDNICFDDLGEKDNHKFRNMIFMITNIMVKNELYMTNLKDITWSLSSTSMLNLCESVMRECTVVNDNSDTQSSKCVIL